jgi:hypothetical protein
VIVDYYGISLLFFSFLVANSTLYYIISFHIRVKTTMTSHMWPVLPLFCCCFCCVYKCRMHLVVVVVVKISKNMSVIYLVGDQL